MNRHIPAKNGIPTYIINLEKRIDRKQHILREFEGRDEFSIHLVRAIEDRNGAKGLWDTIVHIIRDLIEDDAEFIILCEDDHKFTSNYKRASFIKAINFAQDKHADVLIGGVSWFSDCFKVNENLFWIDKFTATQFVVVFRKFFETIVSSGFHFSETADLKIGNLSDNKLCFYPFISRQVEFGYSDATSENSELGRVEKLFKDTNAKLKELHHVASYYQSRISTNHGG